MKIAFSGTRKIFIQMLSKLSKLALWLLINFQKVTQIQDSIIGK